MTLGSKTIPDDGPSLQFVFVLCAYLLVRTVPILTLRFEHLSSKSKPTQHSKGVQLSR